MTMITSTIPSRCVVCGAVVGYAFENGKAEFFCEADRNHGFTVPAGKIVPNGRLMDDLYRSNAERFLLSDAPQEGIGVDRACPVCGAGMRMIRTDRKAAFFCTGPIRHEWEIESVNPHAAAPERCFDLLSCLAPFGNGRRVS